MSDLCTACDNSVTDEHQGIGCDHCDRWTHRTCDTGISLDQYNAAVSSGDEILFMCQHCTRISDVSTNLDVPLPMDTTSDETGVADMSVNAALIQPFNVANETIQTTAETTEESLPPEPLSNSYTEESRPVTYEVFPEGSKRGKPLLVSSDGYRYCVQRRKKDSTVLWICSSRSRKITCYATVAQKGSEFVCGRNSHHHGPEVSLNQKMKISVKVKRVASDHPYKSATEIGKEVRAELIQPDQPGVPVPASLARKANRHRSHLRPAQPKDLDFELDSEFLKRGDFLVADINNGTARHLVFATEQQLQLLGQTKCWFIDGTFKIVGQPFESGQLSSIHGFVKVDNLEKQIPLAFILMSHRRTEDYVKVLTKLKESLPTCVAESFVMDFEQAAWLAVRRVIPGATIRGCVFHFVQALWRKIQELGLKNAYGEKGSIYKYLRLFMGLAFLPPNHIEPSYRTIAARANSEQIHAFINYFDAQWLNHPIFDVESWSVFGITVRTNNDVEGWHHRLNRKSGYQPLSFYRLIPALRAEAESIAYELRHLRDGLSTRRVRPSVKSVEEKIQALWAQYRDKDIETSQLLEGCAAAYGPQCDTVNNVAQAAQVTRL